MRIFANELAELYSAELSASDTRLPQPLQFAPYAQWQRAFCQGPEAEKHLSFWRQQLAAAPACLRLPIRVGADAPRVNPYGGAEAKFLVSRDLLDRLDTMRSKRGLRSYVVLLAAFALLLRQICNQDDIVVGGLIANRVKPGTRTLIGPLVNTFALRFRFSAHDTLADALASAHRLIANAYRHSELPFERVVEHLKAEHALEPKFRLDAVFDYFPAPPAPPRFGDLEATPVHLYRKRAQSGLTMKVWPESDGLAVFFEYQRSRFGDEDLRHVFALYEAILTAMAESVDTGLGVMSLPASPIVAAASVSEVPHSLSVAPSTTASGGEDAGTVDLGEICTVLTSIWRTVMGLEEIGPEDDFFGLGGHSLLAMQIANRIWDELQVEVPVELLLTDAVTVQALSEHVGAAMSGKSSG